MSEPFIGEIRMFAGSFAPRGWALCDGQLLAVSQNDALFSLLGTVYGGDGRTTFGLPDMRGRIPIHAGQGPGLSSRPLGGRGGAESVTVTVPQLPAHSHTFLVSADPGNENNPSGEVIAQASADLYIEDPPQSAFAAAAIGTTGGGQSHVNLQPFQAVNFIISLFGIYPSRH